jgi:hypothetical protein
MSSNQREANSVFIISKGVWDILFDKCGRNQNRSLQLYVVVHVYTFEKI